ncbi:MAG: glycosyltransferase family 39 protein [Pseudomonadota bacterium]
MKENRATALRDAIQFLPLLVFYVIIILIASENAFGGDEKIYVQFALNLSHGYYFQKGPVYLWCGPGYPLVLLPFVLLNLPWMAAKLINALFLYMTIYYFYRTLCLYIQEKPAFILSCIMGVYPPFFRLIHILYTETLATFLIVGFMFHFCKYHQRGQKWNRHLLLASFYLGYLALTKIFFGYVILAGLIFYLILYALKRNVALRQVSIIYVLALLFCTPYLTYTYSLAGKIFYWSNSGGMTLYWMSSPHRHDLGDWHSTMDVWETPELYENHGEFFHKLEALNWIQRDEEFKKTAIENILKHPQKYGYNWIANIGRLLFSCPFSYTPQKLSTFFYLIPNMFIVVLSLLCIYPSLLRRKNIPFEIGSLLAFVFISFGGSSLLSAYARQFQLLVPMISLWIIFTLFRILKIEITTPNRSISRN